MAIIFGILISFLQSVGSTFWKKALDCGNLSNGLFLLFGPLFGLFFIYIAVFLSGTDLSLFAQLSIVLMLIVAGTFDGISQKIEAHTLKKVKMSYTLPYRSLDKLFIIILGFLFFYGNEGYTSIPTFLIAIFTFIITLLLSVDLKKFKIDKDIIIYIGGKFIASISVIIVGLVLLKHTTLELFSIFILVTVFFHIFVNFLLKNDFKTLFTQTKEFYKYRFLGTSFGWIGFFLSFMIIEQSGVVLASLISFISIVFTIIAMKVVLKDNPSKKQILLAFLVSILIGIGYYLK